METITPSLLIRVQRKERDAWDRLTFLYSPTVIEWIKRLGVPERDALDVLQEVFLGVLQSASEFRRDIPGATFRGWLRRITQYKAIDYHRRIEQHPEPKGGSEANLWLQLQPEDLLEPEDSASSASDALVRRGLDLIRDDFETRTWQAFESVAIMNRPAADVAQELSMSIGAVYVAKCRVLKRLREELEGLI